MTWQGKGSTRAWRRTRALVLDRDGHRCQIGLPDICEGHATEVHHRLGRGVSEALPDLEAACTACNGAIGDPATKADPAPTPKTNW